MEEVGYVKSINGEYASVVFNRKSGCGGNCGSCKGGCSSNIITTQIKNTLNACQGDKLKVMMNSNSFYKMIFWAYIFPSITFVLGLVLGITYFQKSGYENYELLGGLVGFAFLLVSYMFSSKIDKKARKTNEYELQMVKIIR